MSPTAKQKSLRFKAITAALLLLGTASGPAMAQDRPEAPALPSPQQPPIPVPGNATVWPLRIESSGGLISIYQPQPEKLEGNTLTARSAVSLTPAGATDPEFGAMWFTSQVFTDRDARTVSIQNITVKQVKLPNGAGDQEKQFGDAVTQTIPSLAVTFGLDQLEATLGVVQKAKEESKQLQTTPPRIVVTNVPTTLVVLDGQPKLQAGQTAGVMRVVNTPFVLLLDQGNKQFYLKAGSYWMTAGDVTAQWTATGGVPAEILAEANIVAPPQPADPNAPTAAPAAPVAPTAVMVAEEPTELVNIDGAPTYSPLPGNDLLYLTNTTSDVFMEVATNQVYILLSGRWYRGPNMNGPWTYVEANALPPAFAQIPTDHPKAYVLASVAGTQMARDAKMDAYIPQTTAISRTSGAALTIAYDGEPTFVPVENSPIQYASNCADPVLRIENGYYCCHQAVWYQAAGPVGPWIVSTVVPQVIYTLPPSCPVYNCRYVYVYDSTPEVVYCGYLPGYTGCYVYGPTVVYGTGYRYSSWYGHEYIPRPYTYGFAPRYEYRSASWGYGATSRYDRTWFVETPTRHDWFGPQGYVDYHRDIIDRRPVVENRTVINEHNTVVNNVTINRVNIYNRTENVKRNVTVNNNTTVINNNRAKIVNDNKTVENNVYAGHDGQVYRRTADGWESSNGKGWTATKNVPEAHPAEHVESNSPRDEHRVETPARETPARETPVHETPAHETPARETPVHEEPKREVPVHEEPEKGGAPHVDPAKRTPIHVDPGPGGLEDDHAARERGNAPVRVAPGTHANPQEGPTGHSAPAEHAAPAAGPGPAGGGHSGGGGEGPGDSKNRK